MPTILRWNGYRFYFYSGDQHEPVHIHIRKGNAEAKFWLEPVSLAIAYNFADNELGKIEK